VLYSQCSSRSAVVCNDRGMSLWTKGIVSNDSEVVTNVCIPQLMGNTTEEKGKGCVY